MNLFDKIDKVKELDSRINLYASAKGFTLLSNEKNWHLFQKDELKVHIQFIRRNNKDQIELKAPLFEEISKSLEIFIRPICCEKIIRDIAKTDLIGQIDNKIYLIRYLNLDKKIYQKKAIDYNINSMIKRVKALQEEICGLLDFTKFIKLN